ncbi:RNA-directed DNA polymerase, eukaryota, reverse transcriptase zinc-binding domain protein, partial [Tanacetum coccineum]
PRGRANDDLSSLVSLIGNLSLSEEGLDKWIWSKDPSGRFKVSSLSKSIQILSLSNHALGDHFRWNSWIPRKVNVCIWRASIDRLATRPNLLLRGVDISSTACPFCDCNVEDIKHCLIKCPKVLPVWKKVWCWWNLESPISFPSFSIADIALRKIKVNGCSKIAKVVQGIFYIVIWAIWKWRNRLVNAVLEEKAGILEEDLFPSIQRLSKLWLSARIVPRPVNWSVWIAEPFNMFM